jgi:hypothetical protein
MVQPATHAASTSTSSGGASTRFGTAAAAKAPPANVPRKRAHPSYNLAKIPFELGIRVQRERLKPSYGDGFHGAPLVVWPTSGDRLPEKGGADAPARQGPKAVIDSGEP